MGANGSFASGITAIEENRRWRTVEMLSNGVKVIELKNPKDNHKAPEESHSPNAVYVMFNKNGAGIKSVSVYGSDGRKIYEIHTIAHKQLGAHYHMWQDGKPMEALDLTAPMKKMLAEITNLI